MLFCQSGLIKRINEEFFVQQKTINPKTTVSTANRFFGISKFFNRINDFVAYSYYAIQFKLHPIDLTKFTKIYEEIIAKSGLNRDEFKFDCVLKKILIEFKLLDLRLTINNQALSKIESNAVSLLDKIFATVLFRWKNLTNKQTQKMNENIKRIKEVLLEYLRLWLNSDNLSEADIQPLFRLSYQSLLFLCAVIQSLLQQKKCKQIEFILLVLFDIYKIYYLSSEERQINSQIVATNFISLYEKCFFLNLALAPFSFVYNVVLFNESFFSYMSEKFIQSVDAVKNETKILGIKEVFFGKSFKDFSKQMDHLSSSKQNNILWYIFCGFFSWLWSLIRVDGINIFITLDFIVYQYFYSQNPQINHQIGETIFLLKKTIIEFYAKNQRS